LGENKKEWIKEGLGLQNASTAYGPSLIGKFVE